MKLKFCGHLNGHTRGYKGVYLNDLRDTKNQNRRNEINKIARTKYVQPRQTSSKTGSMDQVQR